MLELPSTPGTGCSAHFSCNRPTPCSIGEPHCKAEAGVAEVSRAALELLKAGIRPLDIMTRPAFENAITVVMALGGSTNAVWLHRLG